MCSHRTITTNTTVTLRPECLGRALDIIRVLLLRDLTLLGYVNLSHKMDYVNQFVIKCSLPEDDQ